MGYPGGVHPRYVHGAMYPMAYFIGVSHGTSLGTNAPMTFRMGLHAPPSHVTPHGVSPHGVVHVYSRNSVRIAVWNKVPNR